jgi:hypothetical protein
MRRKYAVSPDNPHIHPVPNSTSAGQRRIKRGQSEPLQHINGQRPRKPKSSFAGKLACSTSAQRRQLHIVHDDEAAQVSQQPVVLIERNRQGKFGVPSNGSMLLG